MLDSGSISTELLREAMLCVGLDRDLTMDA